MASHPLLEKLDLHNLESGASYGQWVETSGEPMTTVNPATGEALATIKATRRPEAQLVLAQAAEAFESWRISQFVTLELADAGISGDLADPDHDGIKNLLEFALNFSPKSSNASGLPTATIQNVAGQDYLTLTFRRRTPALDLTYTPQTNGSLDAGSWLSNAVQVGAPIDHGDGTETVTFRDATPISGADRRFLQLQVTRTP